MPEKQTHDDVRRGTTTLFGALEVATGRPFGPVVAAINYGDSVAAGRVDRPSGATWTKPPHADPSRGPRNGGRLSPS